MRLTLATPHLAVFGTLNDYLWRRTGEGRGLAVVYGAALLAMSWCTEIQCTQAVGGGFALLASDTLVAVDRFGASTALPAHRTSARFSSQAVL